MDLHFRLGAEGRELGGGGGGVESLLFDLDSAGEAALEAGAAKLFLALLAGEVGFGVGDAFLQGAEGEIGVCDLGGRGGLEVAAGPEGRAGAGAGCLDPAAGAAEQVDLPAGVEA